MGNVRRGLILAGILAAVVGVRPAAAGDDLVFRALGFFQGKSEITDSSIKCEIPNTSVAFADGAFSMGLWRTGGVPTLLFPDPLNPFGNPCGGWIQLRSNLSDQSMLVDHFDVTYKVAGARRFGTVPLRKGFPSACSSLRRTQIFTGTQLDPANSTLGGSNNSGAPNVAFVQLVPLVGADVIACVRGQYAKLQASQLSSLTVVARVSALAISDSGSRYRSNTRSYNLNLRHLCGNGRVDDGESCDPNAPGQCNAGVCQAGACTNLPTLRCTTNANCIGTCLPADNVNECLCEF
jgi:hypothetical protein